MAKQQQKKPVEVKKEVKKEEDQKIHYGHNPCPPMKTLFKTFFRGVPKYIRKQLCQHDLPRGMMNYEVKKPNKVFIDGMWYDYDGV